ncbi:MAG TPA: response regulator, partial [Terriglobia bacterium]|nr:response regulator [Terriglobia bacterium]
MKHRVLIVDDEPGIRQSLSGILADEGYEAESVSSGEDCLQYLEKRRPDVVLLDIWLPAIDGLETLARIQALDNPPVVIMISGHGTIETAVRSTKLGAFDFIEKPLSIDKTLLTLRHAVELSELSAQNRTLRQTLEGEYRIIGDSVPMKALRQQLALAAPTNGRVLVYGESGTGKELVAHALHLMGARATQPF